MLRFTHLVERLRRSRPVLERRRVIDRNEIESMAERLDVHTSHVQRDYVHGWVLSQFYQASSLAERLVLKGGNALRKGYSENARYSRDIDFSTASRVSHDELQTALNLLCAQVAEKTGVDFDIERTVVEDKKRADPSKEVIEARLYFCDFYGSENSLTLAVRLDVTQFDRIFLPVQERHLIHPYSDVGECATAIRCVKLEEILAGKMRCLLQRKHIADLFDLVHATILHPTIAVEASEIIATFFKMTIFGRRPSVAKGLLLELPIDAMSNAWDNYIATPSASRVSFSKAKDAFAELMNLLMPGSAEVDSDAIFFPAALRNPIMAAADSQTLLRLRYGGIERLVEPYELTYKIRRDGVGREYLFAYDQSGGRQSPPGLKTFVSNKVQSLQNTDLSFEPRATIELRKAGGSETAGRFERQRSEVGRAFGALSPTRSRRARGVRSPRIRSSAPYRVECPFCGKQFPRHKPDPKLNSHKDFYGNLCVGRHGHLI